MLTGTPLKLKAVDVHQRLTDAQVARAKGPGQSFTIDDRAYAPAQSSMKTWRRNAGRALTAMAAATLTACSSNWNGPLEAEAAIRKAPEFQARYEKAEALFKKRCETAGEFIYKTVPNVKGVVWMRWRSKSVRDSDQFEMNDPYGSTCSGEWCIRSLLVATQGYELLQKAQMKPTLGRVGYDFVEAADPETGQKYRYTLRYVHPVNSSPDWWIEDELIKVPIDEFTARYGITWDDISTREDRELWIAGGAISAIDRQTTKVIAKGQGYMMDPGLGSTTGFRSPWGLARRNTCRTVADPAFRREEWQETRDFAFSVLQPTKGESK